MSNIADKLNYLNDTKKAIKTAISNRGVAVSDDDTFRSYASKITEIGETIEKTKFGVTVDAFLGDADANGVLYPASSDIGIDLDFTNIEEVAEGALIYKFSNNLTIKSANFSTLKKIDAMGLSHAFLMSSIENIDFSQLTTIEMGGLENTFFGSQLKNINFNSLELIAENSLNSTFLACDNLESANLSSLRVIPTYGLSNTFSYCPALTNVNFDSLETVDIYGLSGTFEECPSLSTISFPSLININQQAFNNVFYGCLSLTEIHFRADMQETVEAMEGYSEKWGASNATIYFDL